MEHGVKRTGRKGHALACAPHDAAVREEEGCVVFWGRYMDMYVVSRG